MKDYYYILGIESSASITELKSAYRKLSNKFHPDKNDGDKFFEERFKDIQEAYEVLSNKNKREAYDYKLKKGTTNATTEYAIKKREEELKKWYETELKKKEASIKEREEELKEQHKKELHKKETEFKNKYQTPEQKIIEEKAKEYFEHGYSKFRSNDFSAAIRDYNKAIELKADYWKAYYYRGYSKAELGDYEAIQDFSKTIELNDNVPQAYYNRGGCKFTLKDYDGANEDYTKAIKLDPNYADAYFYRGISKKKLKNYKEASSDINKAMGLNPKLASAYRILEASLTYIKP